MEPSDRHFGLEGVRQDLAAQSARSGMISTGGRGVLVALQVGAMMVLARLLTPADFGIMAMVMPMARLVNTIGFSSLQTTVIHQEELDSARASAFFRKSAGWNLALVLVMAATGPALAWFYGDSRVVWVTVGWAATIYVATLASVHIALLKRQLRFGAVVSIQIASALVGVIVAIVAARMGVGYWALLLQLVAWRTSHTVLAWVVCDWRPVLGTASGTPAADGQMSLGSYWAGVSGYRLVTWVGDQADRFLTGFLGGATVLGLYQTSRRWAWYPHTELFVALSDVAVSGLSRIKAEDRYRSYLRRALLPMFSLSLPATAFLFTEAESIIQVLLGDQWGGAVVYFQLMALAAFFGGVRRVTEWIYLSRGDTGRQLSWSVVHTVAMLSAIAIGGLWGPVGVAIGFTVGSCLVAIPSIAYAVWPTPLTTRDVLRPLVRPATSSIAAALVLEAAGGQIPSTEVAIIDLSFHAVLFGLIFAVSWLSLPHGGAARKELREALGALRRSV